MLQSLAEDQILTQIYTISIRTSSGAVVTTDVTVTLVGTNDDPTIVSSINDTPTMTEDLPRRTSIFPRSARSRCETST